VFFFQAEDGIRDFHVTGVQTCALPISCSGRKNPPFDLKLARHHARHAHGDGMKAKGFIDGGTEELRPKRRLEGWTKRLTDERSEIGRASCRGRWRARRATDREKEKGRR